ncbi:hypothetical protein BBP40_008358 [Aspergillus hancockii]|nr:hypothetical protein BBP40_008358 [Aspergillus hancockii]
MTPQQLSQSGGGFRSRRSYPSLNHASLAPLTSRFPIDDDVEPQDYFTPRADDADSYYSAHDIPAKTSYLSSYSVPGTPGVLSHSHSRSGSRARQHRRSKSSTRIHLSDTNLQDQDDIQPFHHQGTKAKRHSSRHHPSDSASRRDAEWMLRAGIALASSTREEKGQSWLAKRESSTSLVDEGNYDVESPGHYNKVNRRSRSGRSTPARSRVVSRRGSRPDITMTGFGMASTRQGSTAGIESPAGDMRHLIPDFVDERIRAEMGIFQQEEYSSESDESFDSEDDIDEQEMQRLTRERGFGLGSWFDRMVEWTVFGVDDWPMSYSSGPVNQAPRHVELAEPSAADDDDHVSISGRTDRTDGASTISDSEVPAITEKSGEHGGWDDAWWLIGVMKRAIL